jgi:integrase/recombinase XerD
MTGQALALRTPETFIVPSIVANAEPNAAKRFLEFFTVPIRNPHTRAAYYHAVRRFLHWFEARGFTNLKDLEPIHVAAYVEQHPGSATTVKQHMAAVRAFLSYLVEKGVLPMNPAREVKTKKFSRTEGKTPAPEPEEVRALLASIDASCVVGLRDRALIGVMAYTFARVSAVVGLNVKDYYCAGKRWVIRFHEKGGKEKEIPVSHALEEILDPYLDASGLREAPEGPLFRSTRGRSRVLSPERLSRKDAWAMVKRRLRDAGLSTVYTNHSYRAAGITNFLANGGALEDAQRIAGHADSRTTKLYDRRAERVLPSDMERVRY